MKTNNFLFVWDCMGLETCINLTEIEQNQILDILKDNAVKRIPINSTLNNILLRARFNSQRYYEIYTCNVEENITREDLLKMFNDNPQNAADLIRQLGSQIYSDRLDKKKVVIV